MEYDKTLFGNTKLSDVMEEIYVRSRTKNRKIDSMVDELKNSVKGVKEFKEVMDTIKGLYDVGVKNDELLVKLATIVQRIISAEIKDGGEDDLGLSEEEKQKLLEGMGEALDEARKSLNGYSEDDGDNEEDVQ